jgi:hypothetical protein
MQTTVETIPGIVSLETFFDALFALAVRAEQEHPHLTQAA